MTSSPFCKYLLLTSACAISLANSSAALAQDDLTFEEIVVTARLRAENLQDIPLAITSFSEADMRRRQLNSLADVAMQTAGFSFEDFASGAVETPVIRGQAQVFLTNPVQNVATFVDGIYLQRGYMIDAGLIDMERIEILKGPQSALYGQNAFSGAISYITKKPSNDLEIDAQVNIGTDQRREVRGAINVPVIKDKLALRVGSGFNKFDGTWENTHPLADNDISPGTDGNLGGFDNWAINAGVLFTPIERLKIEGTYYRAEIDAETPAQYALFGGNAFNLGFTDVIDFNCSGGALWCGELPNNPESVPSENRSLPEPNVDPRSFGQIGNNEIFRASITYELTEALDLFYQYGRVESRVFSGRMSGRDTITGVPDTFILGFLAGNVPFDAQPNGGLQADSHEVRVSFDDGGPVRALIGALYYDSTDFFSNRTYYLPPLGTTPLDQANVTFPATTTILDDETFAIYGSVEYSVDKWTFAAEARYSDEKKRFLQAPDPVSNGPEFFYDLPSVPSEALFEPGNFSFITPRFTVQYQANADSQIYLTAARGAKAGGFNRIVTNFAEEQAYDPEFNWTFEIGSKNTFLDGTLQLNLSAFYIDWTDMQITGRQRDAAITDVNIITNIGGVTTWGVEMEGVWQPVDPLQISFAFSHVAPRVDDGVIFQEAVNGGWCTPDVCDPNGDIGGNTLPRTPVTQATTGIQWTDSLTDTMDYFLRTDISYQGKQYASFLNAGFVGGRTLVNASIGVTADSWDVQIWTRNLLNNEYASSTFFAGNFVYAPVFGERRTAGIMATYSY